MSCTGFGVSGLAGKGNEPWVPQWKIRQTSSGMDSDTRSLKPMKMRMAARKASGALWVSKPRA